MKTLGAPSDTSIVKKQSEGNERAEKIKRAQREAVSRYFLNQQIHACWRASPAPLSSCFVTEVACLWYCTSKRNIIKHFCNTTMQHQETEITCLGTYEVESFTNKYILMALGFTEAIYAASETEQ